MKRQRKQKHISSIQAKTAANLIKANLPDEWYHDNIKNSAQLLIRQYGRKQGCAWRYLHQRANGTTVWCNNELHISARVDYKGVHPMPM